MSRVYTKIKAGQYISVTDTKQYYCDVFILHKRKPVTLRFCLNTRVFIRHQLPRYVIDTVMGQLNALFDGNMIIPYEHNKDGTRRHMNLKYYSNLDMRHFLTMRQR